MTKYLDETGLAYFWCKIKAHITTAITAIGKVPVGGTAGQVLKKNSNVDFDTSWLTLGEAAVLSVADIEDELGLGTAAYHNHGDYYATADSRTKNTVLAAPSSADGAATFRKLVAADIPSLAISKITNLQTTLNGKADDSDLDALLPKQPDSADLPQASTSNTLFPLVLGNTFANSGKVNYLTKANFQTWLGWDDKADASSLSSYAKLAATNTFTSLQILKDGSINRDGTIPSSDDWGDHYILFRDVDGENIGTLRPIQRARTDGRMDMMIYVYNEGSNTEHSNSFRLSVTQAGGKEAYVDSDFGIGGNFLRPNSTLDLKSNTNGLSSSYNPYLGFRDKNGYNAAFVQSTNTTTGDNGLKLCAQHYSGTTALSNSLTLAVDKSGNASVAVAGTGVVNSWRKALGLGQSTGALPLTIAQGGTNMTQDYTNTIATGVVFRAWGHTAYLRVEVTKNFTDGYSSFVLGTVPSGYRPPNEVCSAAIVFDTGRHCLLAIKANGEIRVAGAGGAALGNHLVVGTATWVI